MARSLLIGCGNSRAKKVYWNDQPHWLGELTTIDMNPHCSADFVIDLGELPNGHRLPFADETFDEIGAYDCLEHWGIQGDWRGWFTEMGEYHRILKPGGIMGVLVPIGEDALADPGHTRFFHKNHFGFLSQKFYDENLASGAAVTDYRWFWKKDFAIEHIRVEGGHHIGVILRKPA